jgi:hypothetical protein
MPLIRIDIFRGKPPEYRVALRDTVCQTLGDVLGVPAEDCHAVITNHDFENRDAAPQLVAVESISDAILVQIGFTDYLGLEQKRILYTAIVQALRQRLGLHLQDVALNLFEVKKNGYFGDIAHYFDAQPR